MATCLFACKEESKDVNGSTSLKANNNDIIIEVCDGTSPDWLINEINSIVEPVQPNYRPVSVYSTIFDDVTYILVTDMVNNAVVYQLRFFLCSGESVSYDTAEYNTLKQRYLDNREDFILLWSNSNI
jgi:hypothetical protein